MEPQATVTITNLVRRPQTIELAHDVVCQPGACLCSEQLVGARDHDAESGIRTVRGGMKRVSRSLHLLAKGSNPNDVTVAGLPLSVLKLEQVQRMKRGGDISAVEVAAVAPPPPPAAPAPPAETPSTAIAPISHSKPVSAVKE